MLMCSKTGARAATAEELEPDLEAFASGQRADFFVKEALVRRQGGWSEEAGVGLWGL